jgi:hypothetical protein
MNQLEFFYQEAQIHFLVHGTQKKVMINATEMAKPFGKRTDVFLKTQHVKSFISELEKSKLRPPNGGSNSEKIIDRRSVQGVYFCEELALKFSAWLDPAFEVWVYSTIREITFGRYRKHAQAEEIEREAAQEMVAMREKLLQDPDTESARRYFEAEKRKNAARTMKSRALKMQLELFSND